MLQWIEQQSRSAAIFIEIKLVSLCPCVLKAHVLYHLVNECSFGL